MACMSLQFSSLLLENKTFFMHCYNMWNHGYYSYTITDGPQLTKHSMFHLALLYCIRSYSWKIWRRLSLVKSVNYQQFSKLKPSELLVTFWMIYSFAKYLFIKIFIHPLLPNIITFKFSYYIRYIMHKHSHITSISFRYCCRDTWGGPA